MAVQQFTNHLTMKGHVVLVLLVLLLFQSCARTALQRQGALGALVSPTFQTTSQTKMMLKETLFIPSSDPEKEAKAMYEKALQQYGIVGRTLKEICKPWQVRGCQCAGSSEEVALTCRGIGLEAIPVNLPTELVKLHKIRSNSTFVGQMIGTRSRFTFSDRPEEESISKARKDLLASSQCKGVLGKTSFWG
ncbi:hypothetical protein pipiens_005136 [Culex pipiens pipiens]|uniref:Uncharacterized protein n=1 Tax=Culex pipiens pipiens TaxID=38569 RepID=A0ABD1CB48_CULPP